LSIGFSHSASGARHRPGAVGSGFGQSGPLVSYAADVGIEIAGAERSSAPLLSTHAGLTRFGAGARLPRAAMVSPWLLTNLITLAELRGTIVLIDAEIIPLGELLGGLDALPDLGLTRAGGCARGGSGSG
jgi:hypothetical protein